MEEKICGSLSGIKIENNLNITHILFVDDILIFYDDSRRDGAKLPGILSLFRKSTGLRLNEQKSTLTPVNIEGPDIQSYYGLIFPFITSTLDEWLKYMGFILKPNIYMKKDWNWLLAKLEKTINI